MRARLPVIAMLMAGCGFNPAGPEAGEDGAVADDGGAGVDGAVVDAPPVVIDAPTPIDGPPQCPVEYVVRPSGRYRLSQAALPHAAADADCADDLPGRTHLATWENGAALDGDLDALGPDEQALVYIGGVCNEVDCGSRKVWFWIGGTPIPAAMWPEGQPNEGLTQHVLETQRYFGDWVINNIDALTARPYICECEP